MRSPTRRLPRASGGTRTTVPRDVAGQSSRAGLASPVVGELEGEAFVVVFEEGDGLLEVVPALAGDTELVVLDLRLDLEAGLADGLGERLGLVLGDPLDERALDAVGAAAGGLGLAALQRLECDLAPHELVLEDVQGGLGALVGL